MASSLNLLLFTSLLIFITITPSIIQTAQSTKTLKPKALVLPVTKDPKTGQYMTQIEHGTPLSWVKLTLDLGGESLWIDCENGFNSSSKKTVFCSSKVCALTNTGFCEADCFTNPGKAGCNQTTCSDFTDNSVIKTATINSVYTDVVSVHSTNGHYPGRVASLADFPFACGSTSLLEGLASGVKGMAGLGRSNISLPVYSASTIGFSKKFAICLSSSTKSKGVVFFGKGPYFFLPNVDATRSLIHTPLILNNVSSAPAYFEGDPSSDYFIGVTAIKINGKSVKVAPNLLPINSQGYGGTKISTVNPYTVLHSTIYKNFISRFIKEVGSIQRVKAVAPFGACFNSTGIGSTRLGPAVPPVEFVLQNKKVWRFFGANTMVSVGKEVLCLGFVNGGVDVRTSIVIGGHQLEDNLLHFDLDKSTVGFSSSLLASQTTCSNFNFTSTT